LSLQQRVGATCGMLVHQRPCAPPAARRRHIFRYKLTPAAAAARDELKGMLSHPRASPDAIRRARKRFRKTLKQNSTQQSFSKSQALLETMRLHPGRFWRQWTAAGNRCRASSIPARAWRAHYSRKFGQQPGEDAHVTIHDDDFQQRISERSKSTLMSMPTLPELLTACKRLKSGTSSGLDGVPLEFFFKAAFQDGPEGPIRYPVLSAYLPLLSACLTTGRTPVRWRDSRLCSVYKRGDSNLCSNYRPISVSASAYRVSTAFINMRLTAALEDDNVLHPSLYGYRRHRSCTQPNLLLLHSVKLARKHGSRIYSAFIDLKSAFDAVSHSALMQALSACGAPQGLVDVVSSMYRGCRAFHHDGCIDAAPIHVQRGIRQGCPLSPTLFNILTHVLAQRVWDTAHRLGLFHVRFPTHPCLLYADDILLMAPSRPALECLLRTLTDTCVRLGLTIESAKSHYMVFNSSKEHRESEPPLIIEGTNVCVCDQIKYLGLIIDSACSPVTMYKHRLACAEVALQRACVLSSQISIHHLPTARVLLNCMVLAAAMYGIEVWGPHVLSSTHFAPATPHTCDATQSVAQYKPFSNDLQLMANRLIKHVLRLPVRTTGVVVMLESGFQPAHMSCVRRVSAALATAFEVGPCAVRRAAFSDVLIHNWRSYMRVHLGVPWPDMPCVPPPAPCAVRKALADSYMRVLQPHKHHDTRADSCPDKLISTYVQHVWDGKLGSMHTVHMVPTVPCRNYRWWCKLRTLTLPAPAYTHHFSLSGSAQCALGCDEIGDLKHYLYECTRVSDISCTVVFDGHERMISMRHVFDTDNPRVAAHLAMLLCTRLKGEEEP
jgi:hypothetical protein